MNNIDIKSVILNTYHRETILKKLWTRRTSIKHGKLKYIKKPYTSEDLYEAINSSNYDMVILFYEKLIMNSKINPLIINNSKTIEIFQYIYNQFINLYTKEEIERIIYIKGFVRNGLLDIIKFLDKEGFRFNWYDYNITTIPVIQYFLQSHSMNKVVRYSRELQNVVYISNCSPKVKIWLIENNHIEYTLNDAILEGYDEMIDYFINIGVKPTKQNIIDLIELEYENLNSIQDIPSFDDDICEALLRTYNIDLIENMFDNGLDRNYFIGYCHLCGIKDYNDI